MCGRKMAVAWRLLTAVPLCIGCTGQSSRGALLGHCGHGLSWGLVPVCVVPASCVPYVYATALFYTAGEIPCSFTITVKIYQSRSPIRDRCTRPHTESHLNACLEALALS